MEITELWNHTEKLVSLPRPKNYEQIDKLYAVHSLSFKLSDERFFG